MIRNDVNVNVELELEQSNYVILRNDVNEHAFATLRLGTSAAGRHNVA